MIIQVGNPFSFVTPDPFSSSTILTLNGQGANGSTSIIDSSPKARAITRVGDVQISTAVSFGGGSSILFDGNGDYLTAANSADFAFLTGAVTGEAWVYLTGTKSVWPIFDTCPIGGAGARNTSLVFLLDSTRKAQVFSGNSARTGSIVVPLNTLTHVAFVRRTTAANDFRIYVGGQIAFTGTLATACGDQAFSSGILADSSTNTTVQFQGHMIQRITRAARYWDAFTPPGPPFPTV